MPEKDVHIRYSGFIHFRVTRLAIKLNRQAGAILKNTGEISLMQWRVIALLSVDGIDTLTAIADATAIDKGLLSRNIAALEQLGLVRVSQDPVDRRISRVALTEAGREAHQRTHPHMEWRNEMLMSVLTETQREVIIDALRRLEAAAEQFSAGKPDEDAPPEDAPAEREVS